MMTETETLPNADTRRFLEGDSLFVEAVESQTELSTESHCLERHSRINLK